MGCTQIIIVIIIIITAVVLYCLQLVHVIPLVLALAVAAFPPLPVMCLRPLATVTPPVMPTETAVLM